MSPDYRVLDYLHIENLYRACNVAVVVVATVFCTLSATVLLHTSTVLGQTQTQQQQRQHGELSQSVAVDENRIATLESQLQRIVDRESADIQRISDRQDKTDVLVYETVGGGFVGFAVIGALGTMGLLAQRKQKA